MATNFPNAPDDFSNPSPTTSQAGGPRTHSQQHGDLNDAVEAVQNLLIGSGGFVDIVGLVSDGTTDNAPAVQAAINKAVAEGKEGVRYPTGNFAHASTIVMATPVAIIGAGVGLTTLRGNFNGPLFQFNNSAALFNYKTFGRFRYIGPGSTTTNTDAWCFDFASGSLGAAFCTFENITTNSARGFMRSNALAYDSGVTGANKWAGRINWCSFVNINLRGSVVYGFLWNQGSGTGNAWSGGKPALGESNGAYIEINGAPAPANDNLGVVVGDVIVNNVHAITEGAADRATCAFFRGGPNTAYRSRILLNGCQFDARADYPLDLSSTGSVAWSNVVVNSNVLGGLVDMYQKIPVLRRSRIVDQGVSEWKAQFNGNTDSVAAFTDDVFQVLTDPTNGGGCMVEIVVSGLVAGKSNCVGVWRFLVRAGATPTVTELSENVSGAGTGLFDITTSSPAGNTALFTLGFTASAAGSHYDCQIYATGNSFKVQNGRYL